MRKAVPGKASSTRLSVSQKGVVVVVEEKGLWRSHQKTCSKLDATQARGGGFRLNLEGWALRVRTPAASPGDWKLQSPSFLSSCPPFSPPCPLSRFSCNSVVTAFSTFSFLSIFLLQSHSPPPPQFTFFVKFFLVPTLYVQIYQFVFKTMFKMQLIYQQEVRDTLTKITPGS